jgi:hypothetical protein
MTIETSKVMRMVGVITMSEEKVSIGKPWNHLLASSVCEEPVPFLTDWSSILRE